MEKSIQHLQGMADNPPFFRYDLFSWTVFPAERFQTNCTDQSLYLLSPSVVERSSHDGIINNGFEKFSGSSFPTSSGMIRTLETQMSLTNEQTLKIIEYSKFQPIVLSPEKFKHLEESWLTSSQIEALNYLKGHSFQYKWQLGAQLAQYSEEWEQLGGGLENKLHDRSVKQKLAYIYQIFFE